MLKGNSKPTIHSNNDATTGVVHGAGVLRTPSRHRMEQKTLCDVDETLDAFIDDWPVARVAPQRRQQ